jgi:plasmid stabilization system protein ParE
MIKNVVLSPIAKLRLEELLEYLKQKWSEKVKNEFIERLDVKIRQVSQYPKSCPESKALKGLYQCVVSSQTTLYYRINQEEIEIVTLFDTRQDPKKLTS